MIALKLMVGFGFWLMLLAGLSQAGNVLEVIPFEFRGYQLGEPIDEEQLKNQGYPCASFPAPNAWDRLCKREDLKGDKIGETPVRIYFYLLEGKLAGIGISFKPEFYKDIVDAFSVKFGPPHEDKDEILQNTFGASFINKKTIWHTTDGDLEIRKYGSSLSLGGADIQSKKMLALIVKRSKEAAQKSAKDL